MNYDALCNIYVNIKTDLLHLTDKIVKYINVFFSNKRQINMSAREMHIFMIEYLNKKLWLIYKPQFLCLFGLFFGRHHEFKGAVDPFVPERPIVFSGSFVI